jgi:hypothetical protein
LCERDRLQQAGEQHKGDVPVNAGRGTAMMKTMPEIH